MSTRDISNIARMFHRDNHNIGGSLYYPCGVCYGQHPWVMDPEFITEPDPRNPVLCSSLITECSSNLEFCGSCGVKTWWKRVWGFITESTWMLYHPLCHVCGSSIQYRLCCSCLSSQARQGIFMFFQGPALMTSDTHVWQHPDMWTMGIIYIWDHTTIHPSGGFVV